MEITSRSNEKVKYIKSLNDKKYRNKYHAFYIEGVKVISELLDIYKKKAVNIEFIAYSIDIINKVKGSDELIKKIKKSDILVCELSENVFRDISDAVNSQGIIAVIRYEEKSLNDLDISKNILILDKVQDSGNVGTIIRSANAFGIYDIICIKGTADIYSPKVVRSTMLSVVKTNIVYVDSTDDLISFLKKNNFEVISTSLNTENYLDSNTFKNKCAIVLGNESSGVEENLLQLSDKIVKIKIEDVVESLNVAQASAILLYEQFKQKLN